MTLYVRSMDEKASVEITHGVRTELSTGSHVIHQDDCKLNVKVSLINARKYNDP